MEYNTTRPPLVMREFGRNIQSIVRHLLTVDDLEKRTDLAYGVIEAMIALNPSIKTIDDYRHKLWDQLHIIADYQLNVNAPYPPPDREVMEQRPEPMAYPKARQGRMHYGRTITLMIEQCKQMDDPEKRHDFALHIASFMKVIYLNWHKTAASDDQIRNDLRTLSNGMLDLNPQDALTALDPKPGQRNKPRGPVIVDRSLETARRSGKHRSNRNNNRNRRRR
jgi:hypothetical protein